MAVANTRWYRLGTITAETNSNKIYGSGTKWGSAGINPGATLRIDRQPYAYEVLEVVSDTEITLGAPFYGNSGSGLTYSIDRNYQSTPNAKIAAKIADLLGKYEEAIDADLMKITGKSAYELALETGYNGTLEQWLLSLKNGGEITALKALTEILGYHNAGAHNALYRGKNLGNTFTAAQSAAIRAGTFEDLYPGDYWPMTTTYTYYVKTSDTTAQSGKTYYADVEGTALASQPEEGADISSSGYYEAKSATATVNWRIADLDYYLKAGVTEVTAHHAVIVPDTNLYTARMNPTNTTEGGYLGSEMRKENLARAKALIKAAFGAEHILSHSEHMQNAVKDGKPSGGAWADSVVDIMTEEMVYGGKIYGVANDGGNTVPNLYTVSCKQLNLFRHRSELISNRQWFWLRDTVNGLYFAYVYYCGDADYLYASSSGGGVRPDSLPHIYRAKFPRAAIGKEGLSIQANNLINANRHAVGYD